MDTLVALGSAASYIYSVVALFAMTGAVLDNDTEQVMYYMNQFYFEAAAMILTLITVGKMLEARSKGKTTNALKGLMDLSPKTAVVVRNGVESTVPVEAVRVGDRFVVRPGGVEFYSKAEYVVILAGDHIYKQDYSHMLIDHVEKGARCTVACMPVPIEEASAFGVMAVDENDKIIEFVEKPANPPSMPNDPSKSLASMGIYVFDADYLYELLEEDDRDENSSHDFGKDLIPKITEAGLAYAHPFPLSCVQSDPDAEPYWRDVGTLEAYWKANLDLASVVPELDMYDRNWPIRTYNESLPPAKFVQDRSGSHGMTLNSLVSGGCVISGSVVVQSVLFSRVRVNSFCNIDSAVLLPEVWVGRSCRLRRCVIDRACVIPEGMVIGENAEEDARRFYRSEEGIVLVTREMLRKLGHKQER